MNPNDKLRQAAILVDSLDPSAADALLEKMDQHQATLVRNAVIDLANVTSGERDEVLDEFLGKKQPQPVADYGVELEVDLNADRAREEHVQTSAIADSLPFQFLHNATGQALASVLQHEHPQTIAVVISHLTPERSADVISRLSSAQQSDVLGRVAELDETDPEILREIEQEMKVLLDSESQAQQTRSAGLDALQSILAAAKPETRAQIMANLSQHDQALAFQLAESNGETPIAPAVNDLDTQEPMESVVDVAASASTPEGLLGGDYHLPEDEPPRVLSFDDLNALDDVSLALVLNRADPDITLLALTGSSPEFVERIMNQLPADVAQPLRKKIDHTGPVRLRDIDQAQQMLASIAGQLLDQRRLVRPPHHRFAAAA